jgi:uncharacterized protein
MRSEKSSKIMKSPSFMLVPSLACPAECKYCFGPHQGPIMSSVQMEETLDYIQSIAQETNTPKVKIVFHGGEPLLAGHSLWEHALTGLRARFGSDGYQVNVQSNLWKLDKRFCQLFKEHKAQLGTSLDGSEEITDQQRGEGYFGKTMQGIRLANEYGLDVGCIATMTPSSLSQWKSIVDFFISQRLGLTVHAAVPSLAQPDSAYAIAPQEYALVLPKMLEYYLQKRREIRISTFDQMCRSVCTGVGDVCTFQDCLGMFLAIDPNGDIYNCQRFCGQPEHRLGTVQEKPSLTELFNSPMGQKLKQREITMRATCSSCEQYAHCRGGCAYNAWSAQPDIGHETKDPYCVAYKTAFQSIQEQVAREISSQENLHAIVSRASVSRENGLLHKGPIAELVNKKRHPSQVARTAKRIVAAVELAKDSDIYNVGKQLVRQGISQTQETAINSLQALQAELLSKKENLNNIYIHTTFACQLKCSHCYAQAHEPKEPVATMEIHALIQLLKQAKQVGFRQAIITGGEPLLHPKQWELLSQVADLRAELHPMKLVLRTNFAMPLSHQELALVAEAFDQVVVSVDGDENTHNERRGQGTYQKVCQNLEAYQEYANSDKRAAELSLATVLPAKMMSTSAGTSVQDLANRLRIKRTRFRPLLPLGRALTWKEPPTSESLGGHLDPMDMIEQGFHPVVSCGMGQNIYVEPNGAAFPCYAYHQSQSVIGNVSQAGLLEVIHSERFQALSRHTVNTNTKCNSCEVKYLCGGACRAWGKEKTQNNLDAPPPECEGLKRRAQGVYQAAKEYLEIRK